MAYLKAALALLFAAGLVIYPETSASAARRAMQIWAESVAPALFPFAAVMPFLTCNEARRVYDMLFGPVVRWLFRLPGGTASAIVTGMLSGSPGGALAAARVAAAEGLTKGQAARLAGIACGVSPVYVLSVLGVALNGSANLGWKLVAAQIFAQLTVGVVFRNAFSADSERVSGFEYIDNEKPIAAALKAVIKACGYMVLFSVGLELAEKATGDIVRNAAVFIDLPTGAISCDNHIVLAAALSSGGLCIAFQNMSVLEDMVKPWVYMLQKAIGAILCAGAFAAIDLWDAGNVEGVFSVKAMDFEKNMLIISLIMTPILLVFLRKRSKKLFS